MKEYKVLSPTLGFRNKNQKLEELLNTHAREGWVVKSMSSYHTTVSLIIFERDKNR